MNAAAMSAALLTYKTQKERYQQMTDHSAQEKNPFAEAK